MLSMITIAYIEKAINVSSLALQEKPSTTKNNFADSNTLLLHFYL